MDTLFGLPRHLLRNILLLSLCSGLQISTISITITISSLVGIQYAPQEWMMTLPVASIMIGMIVMTFPASGVVGHFGRKTAFFLGGLTAFIGSIILATGMYMNLWWIIIFGYFVVGMGLSVSAFYIFAANDGAEAKFSGRISGIIMLGGLVAAFLGPRSAHFAHQLETETPLIAVPMMMMGFSICIMFLVLCLKNAIQNVTVINNRLSLKGFKSVLTSVYFWSAALIGTAGYGAMTLTMNATTPWMFGQGMVMNHTSTVISFHLLGMFAPAPISGWIADRYSATVCALLGFAIFVLCFFVLLHGHSYGHFITALILLGIGWSMTMVSGTKKLVALGKQGNRSTVEAGGTSLIALANIFSAFTAGAIYIGLGWQGVLIISSFFVIVGLAALLMGKLKPLPQS